MGSALVCYSGGRRQRFRPGRRPRGPRAPGGRDDGRLAEPRPLREGGRRRRGAPQIGARHELVESHEIERPGYVANATDRCFHCKSELYDIAEQKKQAVGPGPRAQRHQRRRPRRPPPGARRREERGRAQRAGRARLHARTTCAGARRLIGLTVWDKPASACLSSRIPYGTEVTRERLAQIGGLEAELRALGLRQVRVRWHAAGATRRDGAHRGRARRARARLRGPRRDRRGGQALRLRVRDARPAGLPHGQPQRGHRRTIASASSERRSPRVLEAPRRWRRPGRRGCAAPGPGACAGSRRSGFAPAAPSRRAKKSKSQSPPSSVQRRPVAARALPVASTSQAAASGPPRSRSRWLTARDGRRRHAPAGPTSTGGTPAGCPCAHPGVAQVVVRQLVAEGEGDDLVEHLVRAGDAARIGQVLERDDVRGQHRARRLSTTRAAAAPPRVRVVRARPEELVGRASSARCASMASSSPSVPATNGAPESSQPAKALISFGLGIEDERDARRRAAAARRSGSPRARRRRRAPRPAT